MKYELSDKPYLEEIGPGVYRERKWYIKRYCFHCKEVTRFLLCDNCSKYFCLNHANWDYWGDEWIGHESERYFYHSCRII